jgi:hypothetical protein
MQSELCVQAAPTAPREMHVDAFGSQTAYTAHPTADGQAPLMAIRGRQVVLTGSQ